MADTDDAGDNTADDAGSDHRSPGDCWEGDRVARWLRQADGLDRQLAPVSDVLFAAAALQPGERVLDVGCGTGPTTRRAAAEVGAGGAVTGVEVSSDMLAAAAATDGGDADAAAIEWIEADVARWTPAIEPVDVVLSRFGVMFFSDPGAAFASLAAATRSGGRLAAAVWAHRDESDLFGVPLAAAVDTLRGLGHDPELPRDDEGPFSLGDADETVPLLRGAGWAGVEVDAHRLRLRFGGGLAPSAAAEVALDVGPTRLVTTDLDPDARQAVVDALTDRLAGHVDGDGHVVLGGTVLVLRGRRP